MHEPDRASDVEHDGSSDDVGSLVGSVKATTLWLHRVNIKVAAALFLY